MPRTYDLVSLHKAVKAIVPEKASFSITLEIWDHRTMGGRVNVSVTICDSVNQHSCRGSTPDMALASLRAYYDIPDIKPEALGVVVAP